MLKTATNHSGKRYDRLLVIDSPDEIQSGKARLWRCICDCGNESVLPSWRFMGIKPGRKTACKKCEWETRSKAKSVHGGYGERLYQCWAAMRRRCLSQKCPAWKWYGAKGITVCDSWSQYPAFREWAHSHGYEEHLTIERKDPTGNYEPSNCEWITHSENSRRAAEHRWLTRDRALAHV